MDNSAKLAEALIDFLASTWNDTYGMNSVKLEKHLADIEANKKELYELLREVPLLPREILAVIEGLKEKLEEYYS
jgi:uncharacterized protein YihD (DUF1040 family)